MTAQTAEDDLHQQPKQVHLAKQDAATVDPSKLTALTPEVVRTGLGNLLFTAIIRMQLDLSLHTQFKCTVYTPISYLNVSS